MNAPAFAACKIMKTETFAIFETNIPGKGPARVEVISKAIALNSREERLKLELIARAAFEKLSPGFTVRRRPIKCVDIVTLPVLEIGEQ